MLTSKEESSYAEKREQLYGPIRHIFSWDWMYGCEYALADIHHITPEFRAEIALVTQKLGAVYTKIIKIMQTSPQQVMEIIGIPQAAMKAVRVSVLDQAITTIGRFDFARTKDGQIKMLEFNADTPTSVVEVFYVNQKVCEFFGRINPNAGMENHIAEAFGQTVDIYQRLGYLTENIAFSALDWHDEDRDTTIYLMKQSGLKAKFVALEKLRVYEDRLCYLEDGNYIPIDVWYRLHALEKLAEEKDEDGYPTGAHVLDLAARKKLALINPPSAFLAQSKAVQALIWNLHKENQFFTEEEHETIDKYMLPTFLENKFQGVSPYVTKPFFGREGGAVSLYQSNGEIIAKDQEEYYWDQPYIYQKMVDLEEIKAETMTGQYKGRALWGSFLIGGKASGIGLRIGDLITGNLSCFLPISLTD